MNFQGEQPLGGEAIRQPQLQTLMIEVLGARADEENDPHAKAMLTDAVGFLDVDPETQRNANWLLRDMHTCLLEHAVQCGDPVTIGSLLPLADSIVQYSILTDIVLLPDTTDAKRALVPYWDEWLDTAASADHWSAQGNTPVDEALVDIVRLGTYLAARLATASDRDVMRSAALEVRDHMQQLVVPLHDVISQQPARLSIWQDQLRYFDRICGEAGICEALSESTPESQRAALVYRAAAGVLTDEDRAVLQESLDKNSEHRRLQALAIQAISGDEDAGDAFRDLISRDPYWLANGETEFTDALRWAMPDAFRLAGSMAGGRILSPTKLQRVLDTRNPDNLPDIRKTYMRAVTDASEHQNEAFAIALSLSRAGDFLAPTPEEERILDQFTKFAPDLDGWLAAQAAPDGTFQGDGYGAGLMLNNAATLQQPYIEDEAVMRARLRVLDLLCQYNIGRSDQLASFHARAVEHWTGLNNRRSQESLVVALAPEFGATIERVEQRIAQLREGTVRTPDRSYDTIAGNAYL